jgi:4-diphosphocytidyl-2-C-methyl-D-erythritol kinase
MTALRDVARAKVNLTLEVLGRRANGYHELRSLVAFAEMGDTLEIEPSDALLLTVEGPFAEALSGDNLIIKAAEAAKASSPGLRLGRFHLVKTLPVAAGLGGGSADAAAALRLLAQANPGALTETTMAELAAALGSDVMVCLSNRPALMSGRGERVRPLRGFPPCSVLLANPGVQLSAAAVYAALQAEPLLALPVSEAEPPDFGGDFEKLIRYLAPHGNDLQAPASSLAPAIEDVLAALSALEGVRLARLSGSGPTCFALFATLTEAEQAVPALLNAHPSWWIAATTLGVSDF